MLSLSQFITEEQDPKVIEKVLPKVQEYCTANEEIQFIAVQKKTLGVNFSPDCIALTNKRIILVRPKSFGLSLEFKDFSWLNVLDVHMKEGVFAATITVKATSGQDFMEDIPKAQARKLYRFAQEMEEKKKEERRQRELEDKRAMAGGGITVNNTPVTQPQATVPAEDPMEKLTKLKSMLDMGIITQADFDAKKADILSRM